LHGLTTILTLASFGWLVAGLIWRERKTLLAGWLVAGLIWRERKTLLLAG